MTNSGSSDAYLAKDRKKEFTKLVTGHATASHKSLSDERPKGEVD